jgi:hypothetical protein
MVVKLDILFCFALFIMCFLIVLESYEIDVEEGSETLASGESESERQPEIQLAAVDIPSIWPTLDFLSKPEQQHVNHILELYRNPETQNCVIEFFAGICGSREIAEVILANTDTFEIPPALAFALSWEESRFNPRAVNSANRNGSVDRGLFQLNNRSFPHLTQAEFFNPNVNAYNAMQYLRSCIKTGGNEIGALAVYNAGIGRVNRNGAPWVTLDYISRIEENINRINEHFLEWETCFLAKPVQPEIVTVEVIKVVHDHHHFSLPKLLSRHDD